MNPPPNQDRRTILRLIWLYFGLLIFEGSIRKWIFPQLADAVLIIRDPVVIVIYWLALREGLFPSRVLLWVLYALAGFSLIASLGFGEAPLAVVLFGLRTNFLHVPLIFLMAEIMDERDLHLIGRACFILAPAMALLMVLQFTSDPEAWINRGASAGGLQIGTALGRIRPAGFFSYNTGATQFWCFSAAFLLDGWLRRQYPLWMLIMAAASQILAVSVSGSRSAVMSVLLVMGAFIVAAPRSGNTVRAGRIVGIIVALILAIGTFGVFKDGVETLTTRFDEAHSSEGSMVTRVFGSFQIPWAASSCFGRGLGLGTNVGAKITTGEVSFLIAEGEWGRVIGESGLIFGLSFILWRAVLGSQLFIQSFQAIPHRGPLAWLLCSTTGLNVINGQWGQATSLGFSVFGAGLCLAAIRPSIAPLVSVVPIEDPPPPNRIRGRSAYAEALHGK